MGDLMELAARVEALAGPDREVDASIAIAALGFFEVPPQYDGGPIGYGYIDSEGSKVRPGHGGKQLVREFTASLDAAMSLLNGCATLISLSEIAADGLPMARVGRPDLPDCPILVGTAFGIVMGTRLQAQLAIALTAAALRALASGGDHGR